MRVYLVDCDRNVRSELKRMIEDGKLGTVDGMSSRWEDAYLDVKQLRPDIILAELINPPRKSVIYLQKIKAVLPDVTILLMSRNHDEDTVREVYEKGGDFLLHKPVQTVEIKNVLRNLEMTKQMEWMIHQAGQGNSVMGNVHQEAGADTECGNRTDVDLSIRRLKGILQEIGILTEAGSKDILGISRYLMEQNMSPGDVAVRDLCCRMNQNPKSVEQRIRRAAASGMANLASRGMEDYADPVFNEYAGRLYSFEQVKKEMNYIRGKSDKHGNVRVRNFLTGLLECCREI